MALKSLRPLEFLGDWTSEIEKTFIALSPSSSQIRESLDLLCDLKFKNLSWLECAPQSSDATAWILLLKKLYSPVAINADQVNQSELLKLSWPRGVSVKWDRHGDQTGFIIQTKITSDREWNSLRESLSKLNLGDKFWKN
jgi:hypothetical protein